MSQVIIFANNKGGVSVCIPTGELSIEEVQAKDTPAGSLIVNFSDLPVDNEFFDAWELSGTTVTVNIEKAKVIKLNKINNNAVIEAQQRQLNVLTGIANSIDDETWLANLTAKRLAIESASTTSQLVEI
jgi:cellulose biosynthesis protein BcsQ